VEERATHGTDADLALERGAEERDRLAANQLLHGHRAAPDEECDHQQEHERAEPEEQAGEPAAEHAQNA
jgi:hypothetical protein